MESHGLCANKTMLLAILLMLVMEGIAETLSLDQKDPICLPFGPRTGLLSTYSLLFSSSLSSTQNYIICLLYFSRFRVFGDPTTNRRSEDIAFAVSRFFSKNGSHVNYYMVRTLTSPKYIHVRVRHLCFCVQYHGGTNFGRTSAHFVTTRYYDHAPLDEYGNFTDPLTEKLKANPQS